MEAPPDGGCGTAIVASLNTTTQKKTRDPLFMALLAVDVELIVSHHQYHGLLLSSSWILFFLADHSGRGLLWVWEDSVVSVKPSVLYTIVKNLNREREILLAIDVDLLT